MVQAFGLAFENEKPRFNSCSEAGLVLRIAVRKNLPPRDSLFKEFPQSSGRPSFAVMCRNGAAFFLGVCRMH